MHIFVTKTGFMTIAIEFLLSYSPESGHVISLLWPFCPNFKSKPQRLNLSLNQYPESMNHTLTRSQTLTRLRSEAFSPVYFDFQLSSRQQQQSREHLKSSFSSITPLDPRVAFLVLPHAMQGDLESASKNTWKAIFECPKYSNIRISENSLASNLVCA